jgi:L-ascorbate metabolism protein UlaG (beta-lactamase superfamily)
MMIDRRLLLILAILAVVPIDAIAKAPSREQLTLSYLGNAGWQIEDGQTVIIVDPYVSQFHDKRLGNPNTSDDSDEVLVPDEAQIAAHIPRADFVVITHSHSDHMLDPPSVAKNTGAVIIGSEGSANIARAEGVPEKQLIIVKGGDDLDFGRFSLRVIPSLHSQLFAKHYNNSEFSGPVVSGLKAPLHESAYHEGGTFAYLLRLAGHRILIMGSMNYIEREMTGLKPDIALIGSGASRREIYNYSRRLMKALDNPPIVLPTHWDSYANATIEKSRSEVQAFSAEIKAVSPRTRVIVPEYFKPMTFN